MNKFLNILVAIVCLVSMMATAREGSFSSGGYSSSSSYSPSYSSSDWGSSSSSSSSSSYSSSDWGWGSSSSSWDDDDDWGFSSSSRRRSSRSSRSSNRQTTHCTNPHCPVHGTPKPVEVPKYFLYQLYSIPVDQAAYYVNVSGKATQKEKDLWTKTLYSSGHVYEKGKAPEKTEEIEKFIEAIAENKPAYIEYLQKKKAKEEAEQRRVMKGILTYGFIPLLTLMSCLIICFNSANKS